MTIKPFAETASYCGPASLKIVLSHYGIDKSEKELAKLCKTSIRSGTTAENIVIAAIKLGFKAKIRDFSTFSDIRKYLKKKIPVIVDWFSVNDGHYSVVTDIDKENIYIQDPEIGHLRAFRHEEFKRVWFDFEGLFIKKKKDICVRRIIAIYK